MNTKDGPGMCVERNGKELLFRHSINGLFHCTIDELENFFKASNEDKTSNINWLLSRIEKYTREEIRTSFFGHQN